VKNINKRRRNIVRYNLYLYSVQRENAPRPTKIGFFAHPQRSSCHRETGFNSREVEEDAQNRRVLSLDRLYIINILNSIHIVYTNTITSDVCIVKEFCFYSWFSYFLVIWTSGVIYQFTEITNKYLIFKSLIQ